MTSEFSEVVIDALEFFGLRAIGVTVLIMRLSASDDLLDAGRNVSEYCIKIATEIDNLRDMRSVIDLTDLTATLDGLSTVDKPSGTCVVVQNRGRELAR